MPTQKTPLLKKSLQKNTKSLPHENGAQSSIAYITVLGWLIAYFGFQSKNSEYELFHIRQALGLHMTMFIVEILGSFSMFPYIFTKIFWILYIITFLVCSFQALRHKMWQIPFLGERFQKWFRFL